MSLRRLREPRGNLTAGQKSPEDVVDHAVGEASGLQKTIAQRSTLRNRVLFQLIEAILGDAAEVSLTDGNASTKPDRVCVLELVSQFRCHVHAPTASLALWETRV